MLVRSSSSASADARRSWRRVIPAIPVSPASLMLFIIRIHCWTTTRFERTDNELSPRSLRRRLHLRAAPEWAHVGLPMRSPCDRARLLPLVAASAWAFATLSPGLPRLLPTMGRQLHVRRVDRLHSRDEATEHGARPGIRERRFGGGLPGHSPRAPGRAHVVVSAAEMFERREAAERVPQMQEPEASAVVTGGDPGKRLCQSGTGQPVHEPGDTVADGGDYRAAGGLVVELDECYALLAAGQSSQVSD